MPQPAHNHQPSFSRQPTLTCHPGPSNHSPSRTTKWLPQTHRHENGSVSVTALAVIAVWAVLAGVLLTIGGVHAAGARAQSTADFAALAGANVLFNSSFILGPTEGLAQASPCDAAEHLVSVSEPGARMSCSVRDDVVSVEVTVRVMGFSVTRSARAA